MFTPDALLIVNATTFAAVEVPNVIPPPAFNMVDPVMLIVPVPLVPLSNTNALLVFLLAILVFTLKERLESLSVKAPTAVGATIKLSTVTLAVNVGVTATV